MTIWRFVQAIVTIWGFLAIVAIIVDALGLLPYYDIYYRKKTDITPIVFLYPGQNVRLCADFARSVNPKDIERIVWHLKDSSGKEYTDLPHLKDVDLTLLPDFSGIVNVEVKAKLYQDDKERFGKGSIYVVQIKPHKLNHIVNGAFVLPRNLKKADLKSIQIYEGSENWVPALASVEGAGTVRLATVGSPFTVWDGIAYLRYKLSENQAESYQYETAMALIENDQLQQ